MDVLDFEQASLGRFLQTNEERRVYKPTAAERAAAAGLVPAVKVGLSEMFALGARRGGFALGSGGQLNNALSVSSRVEEVGRVQVARGRRGAEGVARRAPPRIPEPFPGGPGRGVVGGPGGIPRVFALG